jgi:hypothetical protein
VLSILNPTEELLLGGNRVNVWRAPGDILALDYWGKSICPCSRTQAELAKRRGRTGKVSKTSGLAGRKTQSSGK